MSDQYEAVRSLPPLDVLSMLGVDVSKYRKRSGKTEFYGPCPIHGPKTNNTSFSVNADGRWYCFSCNEKGRGAIDLTKAIRKCGFKEAVEFLQGYKPSPGAKKEPVEAPIASSGLLQPLLKDTWSKYKVPCEWLEKRIPSAEVRERYGVFCYNNPARRSAYSGRVMIPVKDVQGQLYGYLGRALPPSSPESQTQASALLESQTPKYLFPKSLPKSRFLFGAHELVSCSAGRAPLRYVYLVESPLCVLKFASMGLPALGLYGWSVSQEQIQLLVQIAKGIVYLPDRNKHIESLHTAGTLGERLWVRFPPLPDEIDDPEHLTKEQVLGLTH